MTDFNIRALESGLDFDHQLNSKNVHYKIPKIGDHEGKSVAVVGGGDSALDAALMVLGRNGRVELIVRESVPVGKGTLWRAYETQVPLSTYRLKSIMQNSLQSISG